MLDMTDLECDNDGDIFSGLMKIWDPEISVVRKGEGLALAVLTKGVQPVQGSVTETVQEWARGVRESAGINLPDTAAFLAWNAEYTRLRAMCDREGKIIPAGDPRYGQIVTPTACRALEAEAIDMSNVKFRNAMLQGSYAFLKKRPLLTINRNPLAEADRYRKDRQAAGGPVSEMPFFLSVHPTLGAVQAAVDADGEIVEFNPHLWE